VVHYSLDNHDCGIFRHLFRSGHVVAFLPTQFHLLVKTDSLEPRRKMVLNMPQFELLFSSSESEMLQDAYETITRCDLWDWLREFKPHANEGFLLANHPNLEVLRKEMKYRGHSGGSFATTMRVMELIASYGGWDGYLEAHQKKWPKERPVCRCRHKQGLALGWCGVASGGVPGCEY
jgi:hypothetical protein